MQIFKNLWIQPAAGDAGGSIGAALSFWHMHLKKNRQRKVKDEMQGSYLGPFFKGSEIKKSLIKASANFEICKKEEIVKKTAREIAKGKAVGWFQGRMEFGPRSLGSRSILADPRNKKMQKNLNLKVKFRESFRPFAPSIIEEKTSQWFDLNEKSPYMLLVSNVKQNKLKKINKKSEDKLSSINEVRSVIPAVTHIDNSARIQTVDKKTNKIFYELIYEFYKISKVPILVNTSFNIRGEPIVCTPADAFRCFMGTNLDILVIENFFLEKAKQNESTIKDYRDQFQLD